ncbi:hypothetical protein ES288_A11G041800v1 [Gossypium darwinii]|uniref:Uncharacterized protein n=1 Tax=Gossypium darwinii TaxID=34276 RepID=A0A5D2EHC2_GOSDA|nr:hypothetical protein ES288_A11G041800v1 [Gossypium darwinii]
MWVIGAAYTREFSRPFGVALEESKTLDCIVWVSYFYYISSWKRDTLFTQLRRIWDYEYANYNPVAFDIANHFYEMAAGYTQKHPMLWIIVNIQALVIIRYIIIT